MADNLISRWLRWTFALRLHYPSTTPRSFRKIVDPWRGSGWSLPHKSQYLYLSSWKPPANTSIPLTTIKILKCYMSVGLFIFIRNNYCRTFAEFVCFSNSLAHIPSSSRSDYSIADNEVRNKSTNVNEILRISLRHLLNSSGNEFPISALCKFPRS